MNGRRVWSWNCATWIGSLTAEDQVKREVEKELTARESEPWEIIYFKLYNSPIPVIEQAIETVALMLGTDKSQGYWIPSCTNNFVSRS